MYILANFVIFDDFGPFLIENGHFGPLLRTSDSLLSKSHDISAFSPKDPLRTCAKPCYFDPILTILDPFEGPGGRLWLGPVRAAFGLEDLLRASANPCLGPQIFSYWKVNFCHFAYQGSVKMPFWPYFDLILSPPEPNFWLLAKMCLFAPFARRDLGGTLRDPKFDLFWPFWTPFEGPEGGCG